MPETPPKVSVIIPNFNYGRYLGQAIESVLNQTLMPHEIIVVDDGSTDDSVEVVAKFGDTVRFIRTQNSGVGAARNLGFRAASGDYLAFLDADDYWHPEKLEKQMFKLGTHSEYGMVHCGLTYVDEKGRSTGDLLDGGEGWLWQDLLQIGPVVTANTLVIRRDVFESVGGFDTRRELHPSEDWDVCYRIARRWEIGFVQEALLYYRQHGTGGHTKIARMERAMLLAFEKAFTEDSREVQSLKRAAYSRLYLVLSGSYHSSGQLADALRTGAKAIMYDPATAGHIFRLPFRKLSFKARS